MLKNLKSIFKSSLIYSVGNLSTKLVGFILVPLYTSHFTTYVYGISALVDVTSAALSSIFNLGLAFALFRWYYDKDYTSRQKSMFFSTSIFLVGVSLSVILATYLFRYRISYLIFDDQNYSYLTMLMIINAGFMIVTLMPATLMRLQEKAVLYTVTNMVRLVSSLLLTVYFIAYLKKGVEGIYEAQLIGNIMYVLVLPVYLVKNIELKFNWKVLVGMLKFSAPAVITSISAIVISLADRYVLKYYNGLGEMGIYSLGQKIANTINVFLVTSITLAVYPVFYKMMNDANNRRFYSKMMTYTVFIVIYFVAGLSAFGQEIIKELAKKPAYWPAYQVIPFISFAILFTLMRDNAALGLNLLKKTKLIAMIVIFSSVVNVGLNLLLIPFFSIIGASIAYLSSQFVSFLLIMIYAQKYYPVPYEKVKLLKLILLALSIVLVAMGISGYPILIRFIVKSAMLMAFPVILYFLRFYDEIEMLRIKGFFEKYRNKLSEIFVRKT